MKNKSADQQINNQLKKLYHRIKQIKRIKNDNQTNPFNPLNPPALLAL